jgi:hypothetical protein
MLPLRAGTTTHEDGAPIAYSSPGPMAAKAGFLVNALAAWPRASCAASERVGSLVHTDTNSMTSTLAEYVQVPRADPRRRATPIPGMGTRRACPRPGGPLPERTDPG